MEKIIGTFKWLVRPKHEKLKGYMVQHEDKNNIKLAHQWFHYYQDLKDEHKAQLAFTLNKCAEDKRNAILVLGVINKYERGYKIYIIDVLDETHDLYSPYKLNKDNFRYVTNY